MINNQRSQKRHSRRQFLKLAASATLTSKALSGCGWTLAEVRAKPPNPASAQESSKQLYIYSWSSYIDQPLLNRFKQETGITAVADVYSSNEEMLTRLQAGGGGSYSIIYPSDYTVSKMVELGLLRELDFSRVKGLNQLVPRFQNPVYDPGNQYSVPISWGTTGLIYNAQKLQPAPTDWNYLWQNQQKLSGRITLLDDVREVMGAVLKMLGYSYNSRDEKQVKQAYEKLVQLKSSIASFTSDGWRPQIQSGDLLVAMCYSSDAVEVMGESENLQYVIPKSGTSFWTDTLTIPSTAPNVEGAYAWINFMLKPDVAAQVCERLSFATANKAAFDKLPSKLQTNPNLFPPDSALKGSESIEPVGSFSEVYDNYWTQLRGA
jgi:spermidine/putrescine transport system substrate-binding protein